MCTVTGGTGALVVAAPAVVSAPILASMGFTASGVQAGKFESHVFIIHNHLGMTIFLNLTLCVLLLASIGAAIHSTIGNVVTGSYFAILQSAGAGGYGQPLVTGAIQVAGATVSAASASIAYFTSSQTE